jgi:hypothetical protein
MASCLEKAATAPALTQRRTWIRFPGSGLSDPAELNNRCSVISESPEGMTAAAGDEAVN